MRSSKGQHDDDLDDALAQLDRFGNQSRSLASRRRGTLVAVGIGALAAMSMLTALYITRYVDGPPRPVHLELGTR